MPVSRERKIQASLAGLLAIAIGGIGVKHVFSDNTPQRHAAPLHSATDKLAVTCLHVSDTVESTRINKANYSIICRSAASGIITKVTNIVEVNPYYNCRPVNYIDPGEPPSIANANAKIDLVEPSLDSINVTANGMTGGCVYPAIYPVGTNGHVEFLPSNVARLQNTSFPN